jgi:hypothetical protein
MGDRLKPALVLLAIGIAPCLTEAAFAGGVIVRVSGPASARYRVGVIVPDHLVFRLGVGDRITLKTRAGTREFEGPRTFKLADASRPASLELAPLLDQNKRTREPAAVVEKASNDAQLAGTIDTPAQTICRMTGECGDGVTDTLARAKTAGLSFRSTKSSRPRAAKSLVYDLNEIDLSRGGPFCDVGLGALRIRYSSKTPVTIRLRDRRGEVVRRLPPGAGIVSWDFRPAKDGTGRILMSSSARNRSFSIFSVPSGAMNLDELFAAMRERGCETPSLL